MPIGKPPRNPPRIRLPAPRSVPPLPPPRPRRPICSGRTCAAVLAAVVLMCSAAPVEAAWWRNVIRAIADHMGLIPPAPKPKPPAPVRPDAIPPTPPGHRTPGIIEQ